MVRYSLYLGTEETMAVAMSVAKYFAAATVFPAVGLWEGVVEVSTVVEVISGRGRRGRAVVEEEYAEGLLP